MTSDTVSANRSKRVERRETLRALCQLADNNIRQVFGEVLARAQRAASDCVCWPSALRPQAPVPYSDLDILLFSQRKAEEEFRPLIADFARTLWALGFA